MNIKINDLLLFLNTEYNIDKSILVPYQYELQDIISESEEFVLNFRDNIPISFSSKTKNLFVKFQRDHNRLFNNLIVNINNCS